MILNKMRAFYRWFSNPSPRLLNATAFFAVILIAAFLRLQNIDWDQGHHLHPDERFLTMVTNAMEVPKSFGDYLDQSKSTFNPANLNFKFFVYGTWPLVFTKIAAIQVGSDNYAALTLFGRILAALFDISVVIAIFLIVRLLGNFCKVLRHPAMALSAALIYSLSVLPIQLAHFYATDAFLNGFLIWSFYLLLRALDIVTLKGCLSYITAAAIIFAMAVASKVSAIFMAPLLGVIIILVAFWKERSISSKKFLVISTILFIIVSYFGVRIFDPYLFENKSLLNPIPSSLFLKNIAELKGMIDPLNTFPPNIQWMSKTKFIFGYTNIVFAGLGLPIAVLAILGFLTIVVDLIKSIRYHLAISWKAVRKEDLLLLSIVAWIVGFLIYQGAQWACSMRYFIFVYPFLALLAAVGLLLVFRFALSIDGQSTRKTLINTLFILIFLWPYMFTAIYEQKHSRVIASEWIWENIPNGSKLAYEHWDDPLPLQIEGMNNKKYTSTELAIFPPDSSGKWDTLNPQLDKADYYILSSNRAWGSMPEAPHFFPETKKFYADLFANKYRGYKFLKEFTSYPKLCLPFLKTPCIEFPDQWIEEAFTVYDHPKVLIFENTARVH